MSGHRYRFQNSAVLGTVVEFSCRIDQSLDGEAADEMADEAAETLFGEIDRLQSVFNVFDSGSELSRWRRGELVGGRSSDELATLMAEALRWQQSTRGVFNPLAGELSAIWTAAETTGRSPDPAALVDAASAIAEPRFEMVDGRPEPTGDCSKLNLNAMAKGFIVDRSLTLVANRLPDIDDLLVNAGGDLCHRSRNGTRARVGIENPHRPYDNEPPLVVIEIADEAVATSGSSRRRFHVGAHEVSQVLDPRDGQPAEASASATVVAGSAMVADVAATVAAVLPPTESIAWLDELETSSPIAGLIVGHDHTRYATGTWLHRFGSAV